MATLLVLGSKPDPALPARSAIDAVACANASGRSAADLGLPVPVLTAISAILTSGQPSARHSLRALGGLRTGTLHLLPRHDRGGSPVRRLWRRARQIRMEPAWARLRLRAAGYRWERFETRPLAAYHALVSELCGDDPAVREQIARKHPSTGVFAVALGLADGRFDRVVVAGISFELTHAYGVNPEIAERGTAVSKHGETDVLVLGRLARRHALFTTEAVVAERAGVPRWPAGAEQPPGPAG
ncbi:MAG: hypothetical protein OZ948_19035 [Deltaproteobacteria bacterium]|nr:hypothetical protein [Deltaproteobacteria bacterium]